MMNPMDVTMLRAREREIRRKAERARKVRAARETLPEDRWRPGPTA